MKKILGRSGGERVKGVLGGGVAARAPRQGRTGALPRTGVMVIATRDGVIEKSQVIRPPAHRERVKVVVTVDPIRSHFAVTVPTGTGKARAAASAAARVARAAVDSARAHVGREEPAQTIQRAQYLMARKAFATDSALADAIGVHRSQISRWKEGESPSPENAWVLRDLAFTVEALSEHLDTASIDPWLRGRTPELDGETPLEAIRGGRAAEVLMAMQAQVSGAYA